MKKINQKMMAGTVAMAFLALGAGGLHAQVTNLVTIAGTAQVQGKQSYSYNQKTQVATVTYAAPTKVAVSTKYLLPLLFNAEVNEGNAGGTLPSTAKLVAISSYNSSAPDFQIVTSKNLFICDVSDILQVQSPDNIFVQSGKTTSYNNSILSYSGSNQSIQLFLYDDTGAGGSLQFNFSGLGISNNSQGAPNKTTGAYKETESFKLSNGAGDGSLGGTNLVISAVSVSASGSATITP